MPCSKACIGLPFTDQVLRLTKLGNDLLGAASMLGHGLVLRKRLVVIQRLLFIAEVVLFCFSWKWRNAMPELYYNSGRSFSDAKATQELHAP